MKNSAPQKAPLYQNLQEQVETLVCTQLGVLPEQLTPDTTFVALGANELDRIELIMSIEKIFSTEIDLDDSQSIHCPKDITQYLQKKTERKKMKSL